MFNVPEKYRVSSRVNPVMGSDSSYGNNGAFIIPRSSSSKLIVIASDGDGWEHVSVHTVYLDAIRTPTWSEMCFIKDMFWGEEDVVIQYHPAKSEYVDNHKHTLHLWRAIGLVIPTPPSSMVGII